ncbi:MAG: PKD domain-containing protein [Bacteroidales bacterium]|nr:PKD domain-containing protein [Bacteroidales bacterium]
MFPQKFIKISRIQLVCTIVFILFFINSHLLMSQPGCPNVNAGNNQNINCNANCTNLTATFLQTGQTSAYTVSSVAYAPPYAYNTGTAIMVNIDDRWSSVISLPFNFCFFGNNYNQIVVGSNGVITFDASVTGGFCPWSFTATCPSSSLPTNSIFGAYHDIDPSISGNLYYAILGAAPCRTFVINFYQVAMYSCTSLKATHQIVLYESTNVIEVYIQNKPLCSSWNSGNALIGIQNAAGNLGFTPPGRNTSQWTASNEAWRFTPSGPANYTLSWLQGGTQIGTTPTINVCPTQNTTYTAQVTYTNCNGSQVVVTDDITVSLTNPPATNVSPTNSSVCLGQSQTLVASGASTYTWSPSAGLSATTGSSVTATPTASTTYTVTGTMNGCTSSASAVVNISGGPVVNFPVIPSVCITNAPIQLNATPTGGTYSGTGVSNGVFNPAVAGAGTHTITYTYTNPQNCTGIATQTITVFALPQPNAGNDQVVCAGQAVTFSASGGATYLWSNGDNSQSINVTPTNSITYTVTVTDVNNCSATDDVAVTVNPVPIAVAGNDAAYCIGNSTQLNASGGTDYSWSPATGLDNPLIANPIANPTTSTTYIVTVTGTGGCSSTDDVIVTVNNLPVAQAGNDAQICEGSNTNLNATGGVSYLWNPSTGLSSNTIFNPVASPVTPVTYTVLVTDANGCTATDDIFVNIFPNPIVSFTSDKVNGCQPLHVQFTDNSGVGALSWQWNFGDPNSGINNTSSLQNPSHTFNSSGSYSISLTVVTPNSCSGSFTAANMIQVFPNPVASFSTHPIVADINNSLITFHSLSFQAASWYWNFDDPNSGSNNFSNTESTSHNYESDGTYHVTLLVESAQGCTDSTSRQVTIQSSFTFYVPNTFTPDGDGWNDYFQGFGENISAYNLVIFNRWGALVFESDDYNKPWDGRKNGIGEILQQDVYVYRFLIKDHNGKTHKYYGHVTLLK